MASTYYNYKELESIVNNWNDDYNTLGVSGNIPTNSISCFTGSTEMLRVAQDGFYVRGAKVPVDDKEAETVYNAFKQFLVWSELHRN
jgi:hypothetical protein